MSDEYAARARRALVGARAKWLLRTRALCLADRAQTADSREGQDLQSDLGGCSGGGGGGGGAPRCSSAWLCVAAPLWVVVRVCALLREPRPSGMSHEAVAEYRELFDMFASGDAELVPHARMPELLRLCGVYVGMHTFSGEQWRYPEAPHSFGHFIALMDRGWGGPPLHGGADFRGGARALRHARRAGGGHHPAGARALGAAGAGYD
jgi:hypothetical protein